MPIHERDPWRAQYFAGVDCPDNVFIPTDDYNAYRWNLPHRWVYNKLQIAESQDLSCAPHGVEPKTYPVFSKPIYNLAGMGVGSRALWNSSDYAAYETPGHMWMTLLDGEHVSSDIAVIKGKVHWVRNCVGLAGPAGTFDYWIVEAHRRPALENYCVNWIESRLNDYTGMLNIETIGGKIIEMHLRFSDQWPDLYGLGWLDAMVGVYSRGRWEFAEKARVPGYSVALFGPHGRGFAHPSKEIRYKVLAMSGISSSQITFHEGRSRSPRHAAGRVPPGRRQRLEPIGRTSGPRPTSTRIWCFCADT